MMQFRYRQNLSVLLVFFFCLVASRLDAQPKDTLRVLFVGNSYTYFWNLPQMVAAMGASRDFPMMARKSTAGGASLRQHWDGEKGLKTRQLITQSQWDVVVIQNHSLSSIDTPEEFLSYGQKFTDLIRESGARPMLYETWARAYNPLMQEKISAGYSNLGKVSTTEVAPVGQVWAQVRSLRPDLELFHDDGSHPSTAGTYLTACVFYAMLTGESPIGLADRIKITDKNGEELYLAMMGKDNAEFLQTVVEAHILNPEHIKK